MAESTMSTLDSGVSIVEGAAVLPSGVVPEARITIDCKTGCIVKVEQQPSGQQDQAFRYSAPQGSYIFPGLVDVHIHAREDETQLQCHKETYRTALDAALNGGLVAVAAMPNTPDPLTDATKLDWHRVRVAALQHPVSLLHYVGIGPATRPIADQRVPYKAYTGPSVGSLFFRTPEELENALQHYQGCSVSFHVEDFDELQKAQGASTHDQRRPRACVDTALGYLLPLIERYRIRAKLCHWSTGRYSLDRIREHKECMDKLNLGYNTTIEVSPMHLIFDTDMLNAAPELWPFAQMNPSIRTRSDRLDLIQALKSGEIDYLATDHAPHTLEEKFGNFAVLQAEYPELSLFEIYLKIRATDLKQCRTLCCQDGISGAPWLDTYALVLGYLASEHGFGSTDLARVSAENPGAFMNAFLPTEYGAGFGKIAPNYQGSLTVLNFSKTTKVVQDALKTKSAWSPLTGWDFSVAIEAIICRGRVYHSSMNT